MPYRIQVCSMVPPEIHFFTKCSLPQKEPKLFPGAVPFDRGRRIRPLSATGVGAIVIRLKDSRLFAREQELLAHLGKPGATELLVEQFEYGGHCHPHR